VFRPAVPQRRRWQVERLIGVGGMAQVFLARDVASGERVALKRLLSDDADHLDFLLDEARIATRLKHRGVGG
jgi:serine/threonine protein kinase